MPSAVSTPPPVLRECLSLLCEENCASSALRPRNKFCMFLSSKSFRKDFFKRRCLIPANGFYEWTENKQKVFFRRKDNFSLLLGGIYRNETGGETSFVILTKEATPPVDTFHDRIPILIEPNELEKWLGDISFAADILSLPNNQPLCAEY